MFYRVSLRVLPCSRGKAPGRVLESAPVTRVTGERVVASVMTNTSSILKTTPDSSVKVKSVCVLGPQPLTSLGGWGVVVFSPVFMDASAVLVVE